MSIDGEIFATDAGGHRERPFLLPWNRRLRNLQGISVRNLNVVPPISRSRGKTIADDDVPYNLKSPAKLLARSESKGLQQSRSFTNLTSSSKEPLRTSTKVPAGFEKDTKEHVRPGMGKMRRRSTLHWTGASPRLRQKKLQEVVEGRMADTWFSIHCKGVSEPIYVSEVMAKSMNPSFRFFDLNTSGPQITRTDDFTLKLWAKTDKVDEYSLLIDLELNLRSLQFVGRSLEDFHHPLPQNCVLFHLTDGIYTSFTDMPVKDHGQGADYSGASRPGHIESTSSYDALMRLANLDECIQDALLTREKLESQVNSLLDRNRNAITSVNITNQAREKLAAADRAVSAEKKQLRQTKKRRDELQESIRLRKEAIASGREAQRAGHTEMSQARRKMKDVEKLIEKRTGESTGQIRRICEEFALIYPIEPVKNKPLHFTIRGLYLPNSVFDDTNRDEIAAALGYTSQLTYMLSLYLSTPLPYPIRSNGSSSFIEDPISVALGQRSYPLHPTNVSYKFEYGVFLLNKDIEFLMSKNGLRMLDIRHTLPNLKYLMYVLTAGTGDLPGRKAGGVRGLMPGRVTPSLSRRGSDESVASKVGNLARSALEGHACNASLPVETKGKEKANGELLNPFSSSPTRKVLAHRNSSLREAF